MKILTLHVDYITFRPLKKALKNISELSGEEKKQKRVEEALAVMTSVEKTDDLEKSVEELVRNIEEIAGQVKAKRIVLYPYAHLSRNLASPEVAVQVLEHAEKELKKKKFEVHRAPFGYYKEFEMKVKGHPLSELSREINVKSEEKVNHKELLRKMDKIKMQVKKAPNGLKNNIEIGKEMDLYIISEIVGAGLPLFTPSGATILRELRRFIEDEEIKRGYQHTLTPVMAKSDLYKVSGHWQHYKDDMFVLDVHGQDFALRPMTCPFQFVLYKRKQRSYKELPIRYAEVADLFRNEKSGELRGLTRVRQFKLADAHIICTPEQLEKEFEGVVDLLKFVMGKLGIKEDDIWYRFSKWDPKNKSGKYINDPQAWENSQKAMKKILDKLKIKYVEAEDEAAFYGPKLDLQYKDVYGKEDTLLTVQIDFALPERFDMTYKDKNNKEKRPMVIHRSSVGALERMMSYLLEKTQGRLPTWLAPEQVRVLSFTDRNEKYAREIVKKIGESIPYVRLDADFRNTTVPAKVKEAEIMRIPHIIVVGDKEEKAGTVAVRVRGEKKIKSVKVKDFVKSLKMEIDEKL